MSALLDWFEMGSKVWRHSILFLLTTKDCVILQSTLRALEATFQSSVLVNVFGRFAWINNGRFSLSHDKTV